MKCIRRVSLRTLFALWAVSMASAGIAQETVWQGEITRTMSLGTSAYGDQESRHVEERWTDFRVARGAEGGTLVSFDATWTVEESYAHTSADCTSTGRATGSAPYPWFMFETSAFDDLSYVLYSAGEGGGPDATGTMTVACRGQPPYSFEYMVPSSWLPPVFFPLPGGVLGSLPQDVLESLPQETLDMMRELDATLQQDTSASDPAVTGRVDPAAPHEIRGSAVQEIDGGTITLTWNLTRPLTCDDAEARERLVREAQALRDAQGSGDASELNTARAPYSGPPLSTADVTSALVGAIGNAEHIAMRDVVGSDEAGIRSFAVRLSATGQVLPTLAHVQSLLDTTCVAEGSMEAARSMMVGSVQWVGDAFRVNVRAVDVETGAILDSVSIQGTGGPDELPAAVRRAFSEFLRRS